MSSEEDKIKNSRRRLKDENACKRQTKLAKLSSDVTDKDIDSEHRFHKHHSLNCGNSRGFTCSNPRKTFNELTIQEKRMYQDMDGKE